MWVFLPFFPQRGEEDGWFLDSFMRKYLSRQGLPLIENQADDDIFLLLDADELPLPEVLLFLKLYDGYSEPIRFGFRWTVFGFYWLKTEEQGMLVSVLFSWKVNCSDATTFWKTTKGKQKRKPPQNDDLERGRFLLLRRRIV